MSVYLVKSNEDAEDTNNLSESQCSSSDAAQALDTFWPRVTEEIRKIQNLDPRCQTLPLARIKKIMKLDEDVKMISAEAPVLFAKAAELFIHELTLRAWLHTEDNKRRTLQRNDIAMAISKFDQFDFLIDIVPRDEVKPTPSRQDTKAAINADQVHYYFQLAQQHNAALAGSNAASQNPVPVQLVQPAQIQTMTVSPHQEIKQNSSGVQLVQIQGNASGAAANSIQLVQQIVSPSGDVQHVPIQLNSNQMQMIRMQVQGNASSGQPIILQAAPGSTTSTQQILQVTPNTGSTPVFIQSTNSETG